MIEDRHRFQEETEKSTVSGRIGLGFVLLLHLIATFIFFPPWEAIRSEPLFFKDHPVHTHRVYLYREALRESLLPWGYDPAISAGTITGPGNDVGAKVHQVLGAIFGFIPPGEVVRLVLFLTVLTAPLGTLLACRRLGFGIGSQACVMAAMLPVIWRVLASYFSWGLVSFAAASLLIPYVLLLFLDFVSKPGYRRYLACLAGAAALFLFHVLGPFVIAPSLVLLTLGPRNLSLKWRAALVSVPVAVALINAFWLAPVIFARSMPPSPWEPIAGMETLTHLTASSLSDTLWQLSWEHIASRMIPLPFVVYGLVVLYRRVNRWTFIALAFAIAFAIGVRFFGSFLPIVVKMQPLRFMAPAVVLLAIPAGLALEALGRKFRLPGGISALLVGLLLIAGAVWTGRPEPLELPPSPDPLREFLDARTSTQDRLLLQSLDGYRNDGYEAKVFPIAYNREVIGNTFPEPDDPSQFHRDFLWGRALSSWQPSDLRVSLERWGVSWVFVQTDEAHALLAAATGAPSEIVGAYRAFPVPSAPASRMLVGSGRVAARVNRFDLSDVESENGLIVLRYRYHPGWRTAGGQPVLRYSVPEDPVGFIALENPGRNVTLRFDPAAMLSAPWPAPMPDIQSKQNAETPVHGGMLPLGAK